MNSFFYKKSITCILASANQPYLDMGICYKKVIFSVILTQNSNKYGMIKLVFQKKNLTLKNMFKKSKSTYKPTLSNHIEEVKIVVSQTGGYYMKAARSAENFNKSFLHYFQLAFSNHLLIVTCRFSCIMVA